MSKHKILIIAISALLLVCFVTNYSLDKAVETVTQKAKKIGYLGTTIMSLYGIDFQERVDFYVPPLRDNPNLGNYLDPFDNNIYSISNYFTNLLPNWLMDYKDQDINVRIYPTFYSADFVYQIEEYSPSFLGIRMWHPLGEKTAFSRKYCIRLHITTPDYSTPGINKPILNYEVYIYKHPTTLNIEYFVIPIGSEIGFCSTRLNTLEEFRNTIENDNKLTSATEKRLYDIKDNSFKRYKYSCISNMQNTDLYIDSGMDKFLKGE